MERMDTVALPDTLLAEIDQLVRTGRFASRDAAVVELLRLGLESLHGRGPAPRRPPFPPGHRDPHDDAPIDVEPGRDVNWAP